MLSEGGVLEQEVQRIVRLQMSAQDKTRGGVEAVLRENNGYVLRKVFAGTLFPSKMSTADVGEEGCWIIRPMRQHANCMVTLIYRLLCTALHVATWHPKSGLQYIPNARF